VRLDENNSLLEYLDDENVVSEVQYKSKTGKDPPQPPDRDDVEYGSDDESCDACKEYELEASSTDEIRTTTENFLVGRKLCFAWTNLKGQRKVVHGVVAECDLIYRTKEVVSYKVVYDKESRALVNAVMNGCGSVVPESQRLSPSLVVGGCVRYEEQTSRSRCPLKDCSELPFYSTWIDPDLRSEELVASVDATHFPRLTVVVRGFQLVLSVNPDAKKGVFLSCRPVVDSTIDDSYDKQESFLLNAGDLVDLGVASPLRLEDKLPKAAFSIKNFIQSCKCEEWSHVQQDSGDILDITDFTGDLHEFAKGTIFPYVKERNDGDCINVHREYDAEGSVHYLLGHASESQGPLIVPCDGSEVEVFVNQSEECKKVRRRKGCSIPTEGEGQEIFEDHINEDVANLKVMNEFGAAELETAGNYLFKGLCSLEYESEFPEEAMPRVLVCAALLHRRARCLYLDANDDDVNTKPGSVNLMNVLDLWRSLVAMVLKTAKDEGEELKLLHSQSNVDGLLQMVMRSQYAEEQLSQLVDILD